MKPGIVACSLLALCTLFFGFTPPKQTQKTFDAPQELSPALKKEADRFAERFKKIKQGIDKGDFTFREFDVMFRAMIDQTGEVLEDMGLYEAEWINLSKLKFELSRPTINTTCADCAYIVDVWVDGCLFGGGDTWMCFLLGEQRRCICETSFCGYDVKCLTGLEG
jgi:hypothetical protein